MWIPAGRSAELVLLVGVHAGDVVESGRSAAAAATGHEREALAGAVADRVARSAVNIGGSATAETGAHDDEGRRDSYSEDARYRLHRLWAPAPTAPRTLLGVSMPLPQERKFRGSSTTQTTRPISRSHAVVALALPPLDPTGGR